MVISQSKQFAPGQTLTLTRAYIDDQSGRKKLQKRKYRVIKHYPHHVLTENAQGIRECFTNADLLLNGILRG